MTKATIELEFESGLTPEAIESTIRDHYGDAVVDIEIVQR